MRFCKRVKCDDCKAKESCNEHKYLNKIKELEEANDTLQTLLNELTDNRPWYMKDDLT
jgi:hypothetical protein